MIRKALICFFAVMLLVFGTLTGRKMYSYYQSQKSFASLAQKTVTYQNTTSSKNQTELFGKEEFPESPVWEEYAPIAVDFDALRQENEDCIAWLYSPDTPIHYPVMRSADNEDYLHTNFQKQPDAAGCIFLDCRSATDFTDEKSILYGHNMKDDSMFGSLDGYSWGGQSYYEKHPVLYLLTPNQNYRLDVFAGTTVSTDSDVFETDSGPRWMDALIENSGFHAAQSASEAGQYMLLTTCSGRGYDTRYMILCAMKPIG